MTYCTCMYNIVWFSKIKNENSKKQASNPFISFRSTWVAAEKEAADIYVIKTNEIVPNMS